MLILSCTPLWLSCSRGADYPGNVRDLRQLALRIAVRHVGPGPITPGDVPDEERPSADAPQIGQSSAMLLDQAVTAALSEGHGYREIRDAAGDTAVRLAVDQAGGNLRAAAHQLGVTDRMLQQRRAHDAGMDHGSLPAGNSPNGRDGT